MENHPQMWVTNTRNRVYDTKYSRIRVSLSCLFEDGSSEVETGAVPSYLASLELG